MRIEHQILSEEVDEKCGMRWVTRNDVFYIFLSPDPHPC